MSKLNEIEGKLKRLKLTAAAADLSQSLELAEQKNWSALQVIEHLLDDEIEARFQIKVARRFKESRLSHKTTIDQFDFNFHKSRKEQKARILNLLDLVFIQQAQDVILIGNPGVGKTFLARCIAYAATQAGIKVLFTTAVDMINHLNAAAADQSLLNKLHVYQAPDLLVIDEIGYLPLGANGANLFYQIISARHERRSTIITTNLPCAEWGKLFDNANLAVVIAIADRLFCHSEVIILEGSSYRQKTKK
jgi:DNA replication protein DnaC